MNNDNSPVSTTRFVARAFIGPILILMVAMYFYYMACCLQAAPIGQLGAGFWPKMILIGLIGSCLIKFGEIILNRDKLVEEEQSRAVMDNVRLILMIGIIILTVFAIDFIGFAIANTLFMLVFLVLVGFRKPLNVILVSIISTVVMLYIFVKVVYLPLPRGYGIFEDISLFLYRALYLM